MKKLKFGPIVMASTIAGFLAAFVIYRLLARYAGAWLSPVVIWGIAVIMIPLSLFFGCTGYFKAPGQTKNFLNAVIIYLLAFDLYSFGWQKIFGLQMVVILGMLDMPFNSLDGETLTWAYFRRSYPFTVAIAITQISGSLLLLFRRTRLLGLIILIPVLVNIILIDTFYHLHTWVLIHALVLTTGILFLLFQHLPQLTNFFFSTSTALHLQTGKRLQWIAVITVITVPLLLLITYKSSDRHPELTGKYQVEQLQINGKPEQVKHQSDSLLTTVYMDRLDNFALEFNHYNSRYIGTYHLNENDGHITVQWHYPAGFQHRFEGILKRKDKQHLFFRGVLGTDSIQMQLTYVPEPK